MVYRFIDDNKNIFGLRWLCNKLGISLNCYYNYKKEAKRKYHERLAHIFELIKYVYYNNNRVIGYRSMRIFIKRYGYEVSNTTMHKYMNKQLNLCAIIMHSKPGYKAGKKKYIERHSRNPRWQKYTDKTIHKHNHQYISNVRTDKIITYVQSYQYLYTKYYQKTNDVKYPFLHFLFSLWRNAWFCLRIYDKMQMLHSNITKLIAQKEKRIVYL